MLTDIRVMEKTINYVARSSYFRPSSDSIAQDPINVNRFWGAELDQLAAALPAQTAVPGAPVAGEMPGTAAAAS
jgi:hypothetical protein